MLKPCVWTDTDIDAVYFKIHRATTKSCELKKTNKKKTTFNLSHKNHNSVMNPKRDENRSGCRRNSRSSLFIPCVNVQTRVAFCYGSRRLPGRASPSGLGVWPR